MKGFKLALAVLAVSVLAMGCAKQTTKSTAKEKLQKIHFDFDQSNIKAEYEDELKGNAGWMNNALISTTNETCFVMWSMTRQNAFYLEWNGL